MELYRFSARLSPGKYTTGKWRLTAKQATKDGIPLKGIVEPEDIMVVKYLPFWKWLRKQPWKEQAHD